jgi:hypothetical protein
LLKPPCLPGIELSVPLEYCWVGPAGYPGVAGAVRDDPMSLQPIAPQHAKATAVIDALFIEPP